MQDYEDEEGPLTDTALDDLDDDDDDDDRWRPGGGRRARDRRHAWRRGGAGARV